MLNIKKETASAIPIAAKQDMEIYKYGGITTSTSVINVESRGGEPPVE